MVKFDLVDRYRLELRWEKTSYETSGICKLTGAYFSGPALAEAERLNDNDHIMLDFFSQYLFLVKSVYVAKFSWKQVDYRPDGTIFLGEATITHDKELNRVPKLGDNDYLVIDTSNHSTELHPFNTVYKTYVVNRDTQLYAFGRK